MSEFLEHIIRKDEFKKYDIHNAIGTGEQRICDLMRVCKYLAEQNLEWIAKCKHYKDDSGQ